MVARKRYIKCLLSIVLSLLASGCAVKSDQLTLIKSTFDQEVEGLIPYAWTLDFGDYQSTVYASEIGDMTILSNQLGDAVVLENFELRETHRLGRFRHFWQIISGTDRNMLYKQGEYSGTFQCGDWLDGTGLNNEKSQTNYSQASHKVFKQTCIAENNASIQNTIVLDEQENVQYMEFFLLGEEHSIKLQKS